MSGGAAGRQLGGGGDGFTFQGLVRVVRQHFEATYRQRHGRPPAPHALDRLALICVAHDEAAGDVDHALGIVDAWVARWWGLECHEDRPISPRIRGMLEHRVRVIGEREQHLARQRERRFLRRFA